MLFFAHGHHCFPEELVGFCDSSNMTSPLPLFLSFLSLGFEIVYPRDFSFDTVPQENKVATTCLEWTADVTLVNTLKIISSHISSIQLSSSGKIQKCTI